ncbi:MotY family protein [Vibrio azureus]|nr:OmpA family protein [Vibrio azureus]
MRYYLNMFESFVRFFGGVKFIRFSFSLIIISFVPFKTSFAFEDVIASMDLSKWNYKGDSFKCRLIHSDNVHGKFYFHAEPNKKVSLVLNFKDSGNNWRGVVLSSQLPPWKKKQISSEHSSVTVSKATNQFSLNDGVEDLLENMANGRWVSISLYDDELLSRSLRVTLPVIGIQSALADFKRCRGQLPKLSFSQARDVNLRFHIGQKHLSNRHKAQLRDVYNYITKDKRVIKILIDGHTDNTGDALSNLTLSRSRAQQVADQLVLQGIAREMIEVRAHGARYPTASNHTKSGKAKNRRVTLRLVRDDEQTVPNK